MCMRSREFYRDGALDWRQIRVGELVEKTDIRWAELDVGVEQATKARVLLIYSESLSSNQITDTN